MQYHRVPYYLVALGDEPRLLSNLGPLPPNIGSSAYTQFYDILSAQYVPCAPTHMTYLLVALSSDVVPKFGQFIIKRAAPMFLTW